MIYSLRGKAIKKGDNFIIFDCRFFIFKIFLPTKDIKKIVLNKNKLIFVSLHLDLAKKEGKGDLYGFLKEEEKEIFDKLNSLKGVGPKFALKIINSSSPKKILEALRKKDISFFSQVLNLSERKKKKLFKEIKKQKAEDNFEVEELKQGLANLGYSKREINKAVKETPLTSDLKENFKKVLRKISAK